MSATGAPPKKVWTEAELQALPEEGYIHEVVDGELVMSPENNFYHESLCERLNFELEKFNRQHRLGVVLGSNLGCWMQNENCLAPDIAFIPKARIQATGFSFSTAKFFPGAPDLAIEILSPNNTRAEIDGRLKDFFMSGTQIAWIIDPDKRRAEICTSPTQRKLVGPGGSLDGEHLLPGFKYALADLFRDWDWG